MFDDHDDNVARIGNDIPIPSEEDVYLGTIYWDPYCDSYWRSENAKELVMTRLFSQNVHQTAAPVVIMALKIRPTWDDTPTPMTWNDTRDLLYQFGKALQLTLNQAALRDDITLEKAPIGHGRVLGSRKQPCVRIFLYARPPISHRGVLLSILTSSLWNCGFRTTDFCIA